MRLSVETSNELSKHIFNLAIESFKIATAFRPSTKTETTQENFFIAAHKRIKQLAMHIGTTLDDYNFSHNTEMKQQIYAVITNTLKADSTYNNENLINPTKQAEHKAYHQIKSIFENILRLIPYPAHETNFSTSAKVDYSVIQSINASLDAIQDIPAPCKLQSTETSTISLADLITLSRRNSGFSQSPPCSPLSDESDNTQTFGPNDQAHRPFTSTMKIKRNL